MKSDKELRTYPLNQLYFYLTEGCNLKCRHCWIAPKFQDASHSYPVLSVDLFKSIVKQAKPLGLSGVKLTGGEPLLHPEIGKILESYQRSRSKPFRRDQRCPLYTLKLPGRSGKCKNHFVSVSLDGADASTHEWVRGVAGCFEESLKGVKNLVNAEIKPQIIMSIVRRNKDQMEASCAACRVDWGGIGQIQPHNAHCKRKKAT